MSLQIFLRLNWEHLYTAWYNETQTSLIVAYKQLRKNENNTKITYLDTLCKDYVRVHIGISLLGDDVFDFFFFLNRH